jgi:exopolysaccharide production protein ExoQ
MQSDIQNDGCVKAMRSTDPVVWIVGFFFALRVVILLICVRFFGLEPYTGAAAGLTLNFMLLFLVVVDLIGRPTVVNARVLAAPDRRWVLSFLALSGCSLVWSVTASGPAAIAFWCAMAADTAMVLLLVRVHAVGQVAEKLMTGFVCGGCVVAVVAWIMPAQSDLRLGDEQLLGPNQIGYICAFAFFCSQYLTRIAGRNWSWAAVLLGVTVVRSLSKTTIVALLVSQVFLFLRDRSLTRKTRALMISGLVLIVAVFWNLFFSYFDVYSNAGNQAESLTGRLGLWAIFLDQALQQPWIGHGFHSVWKVIPPFGPDQFEARHAHNELLQQFYAYGALGMTVLVGLYRSFWRAVRALPTGRLRALLLSLVVFVLARGLADTEPFDLSLPLWAVVLFSYLVDGQIYAAAPGGRRIPDPQPPLNPAVHNLAKSG